MAKAKPKTEPQSEPKTQPKAKKAAAEPAQPAPAAKPPERRIARGSDDASIDSFTQGIAALQKKDYAKAAELFATAVAGSDRPEVTDRARQFLAVARQKAEETGGKTAKGEPEDPYLLAVYEKNRGRLKEALDLSKKGGRDQKDDRFAYLAASIHALENRIEEAAQALAKAVELNPRNRIHAFHDPDFAELRKNRDHRALFGLS
jgi:tetratricopeptide (TPR) repeat protein